MKKVTIICLLYFCMICLVGCFMNSIVQYKVVFETNGGTHIDSIKTSTIKETPVTTKINYIFDGWYLDNQFTTVVVFPYQVNDNVTLYAKWLKVFDTTKCNAGEIKFLNSVYSSSISYNITPNTFNCDRLAELGYNYIEISVKYRVSYKKDYDMPFDIGYAGSPKYEFYILNAQGRGYGKENLPILKNYEYNEYSYNISFVNVKTSTYTLTFSTDNAQNIIYFDNILVTYRVLK